MTPPHPQRPHNPLRAIGFGCAGAALFTLQDASFKWLSAEYAILQIIFLRSILAVTISGLWVQRHGGMAVLRVRRWRLFAGSTAANLTAWYCFYTGLSQLPLTIAVCIFFLTPVVIAIGAVLFLGEPLGGRQLVSLMAGFGGVLIITNPFAETAPVALASTGWILISVIMWSAMALITRALESSITVGATLFYNNLAFLLVSAFFLPLLWQPLIIETTAFMLFLGVLGVAAQACVFSAYRSAHTAVAAITEYTAMAWAIALGWLVWDEQLTGRNFAGVALIIAAGLIIIRFRRRRREVIAGGH